MARGVNKVILIGNLGDEPLCRTTHSGCSVTNISMVTNEVRRNIDTGETTEYAEWHRVVMWGKLADIAKQYLHKGSQIYIEGKLRTRSFMDKQGQKRSVTEIVADEMQMLGTRTGMTSSLPQGNPYRNGTAQNYQRSNFGQSNFNQGGYPANPYGGNTQMGGTAPGMQNGNLAGNFSSPYGSAAPDPAPYGDDYGSPDDAYAKPQDTSAEEQEPRVRDAGDDEIPF